MSRFSDEEVRRYSRQLVLPELGGVGQERLRAASLDAESEVTALYLAAAGVGRLRVPSPAIADAVRELNPLVEARVDASLKADPLDGAMAAESALKKILDILST
jgi:molybdopterin/thiamine biosynthesis adenylyltransferase